MSRHVEEADAFTANTNLLVSATPLIPEEGAAVIAFRSDCATQDPDTAKRQLAAREDLHDFMRSRGWRTIERTMVLELDDAWAIDVLVSDERFNVVITHNGVPWLYQGTLYDQVTEDAKTWLSRAATQKHIELVYFTDPGGEFTRDDADEYDALLEQQRAIVLAVPITWHIG
jgi:hypothetical protein